MAKHEKTVPEEKPGGDTASTGVRSRRSEISWAVAVAVTSLALTLLLHLPFLSSYVVRGDDFALLSQSARFFSPSLWEWILNGYETYNITFPEFGEGKTNFIRPTINASVYVDSWLSPNPTSVRMLATNYVGHAVSTGLVFLLGLWVFGLSLSGSFVASVLFLGSSATTGLLTAVAYRGDMLAGVFALGALLVMHWYVTGRATTWKLVATASLLTLAVFAKEAAVAAPAVVGLYAAWRWRDHQPHRRHDAHRSSTGRVILLAALLFPLVAYAAARLHAGLGGNYVLEELPNSVAGVPRIAVNPLRFLLTAFLPPETETLQAALSGRPENALAMIGLARALVMIGLNVLAWVFLAMLCRLQAERRRLLPLVGLKIFAQ
jgi:hypothetical protein